MTWTIVGLGLVAGALTTLTGQGGGLLLLLALSPVVGPHAALALTTPALLFGNAHRAFLYRREAAYGVAARVVAGALPGAFVGGLLVSRAPGWIIHVVLVALTLLAVARALGKVNVRVPTWSLPIAGFVVGALTGTAGGAGVLVAPLLLTAGLSGGAFVGTAGLVGTAMHVGRVIAYGATGLILREHAVPVVLLAGAIFVGNHAGERARSRLSDVTTTRLEYGALVLFVTLAVSGVAR